MTLARLGLVNLASVGPVTLREALAEPGGVAAKLHYDAEVWYCELTVRTGRRTASCVMFGATPILAEADGLLESLIEEDVAALRSAGKPWSGNRAVKNFMASELHQQIVASETNGHGAESISHHLRGVVSVAYVNSALSALATTMKWQLRWRQLASVAALTVLSVLSTPALLALDKGPSRQAALTGYVLDVSAIGAYDLWIYCIPSAVIGAFIAAKLTNWWLTRIGGKHLRNWIRTRKLLHPVRTALLAFLAGGAATVSLYHLVPLWADREGRLYGFIPVTSPIDQPAAPVRAPLPPTAPPPIAALSASPTAKASPTVNRAIRKKAATTTEAAKPAASQAASRQPTAN